MCFWALHENYIYIFDPTSFTKHDLWDFPCYMLTVVCSPHCYKVFHYVIIPQWSNLLSVDSWIVFTFWILWIAFHSTQDSCTGLLVHVHAREDVNLSFNFSEYCHIIFQSAYSSSDPHNWRNICMIFLIVYDPCDLLFVQ